MTFKLLFDHLQIKKWRQEYYKYGEFKNTVLFLTKLIKNLELLRRNFSKEKDQMRKDAYSFRINLLGITCS
jgi:hypothetical protein